MVVVGGVMERADFICFCFSVRKSLFLITKQDSFFLIYVELTTEISYFYISTEKHCL